MTVSLLINLEMKESTLKKLPKEEIKDNKLVKWTAFPSDNKNAFNFSSVLPIGKTLKCTHTFPVSKVYNIRDI
jgi:hypothetical protein